MIAYETSALWPYHKDFEITRKAVLAPTRWARYPIIYWARYPIIYWARYPIIYWARYPIIYDVSFRRQYAIR
jgi:hypothetical protein